MLLGQHRQILRRVLDGVLDDHGATVVRFAERVLVAERVQGRRDPVLATVRDRLFAAAGLHGDGRMTAMRSLGLLCLTLVLQVLAGCAQASSGGSSAGAYDVGAPCTQTEDCPSSLCVGVGGTAGVCTRTCASDGDCPQSPTWKCLDGTNVGAMVCACKPNASTEICGDGVDNDCNGRVDDCLDCNGTVVSADDPANCGACGLKCRSDQTCSQGACRCAAGEKECGGRWRRPG
jgi:hypothetical protein